MKYETAFAENLKSSGWNIYK